MNLGLEYDASRTLFGNEMLMPVARDILELGADEFVPAHIGRRGSDIQGAMSRLIKLGYITVIENTKPKWYRFTRGPFEELVAIFSSALIEITTDKLYEFVPLDPSLKSFGQGGFGWQDQIDKAGARHLCDGTSRIALLLQLYDCSDDTHWAGHYGWAGPYYSQLRRLSLIGDAEEISPTEWHFERRLPSPFWQLVPIMWQYLLDNYPDPKPGVTPHVATLYRRQPQTSAFDMAHPGEARRVRNMEPTYSFKRPPE